MGLLNFLNKRSSVDAALEQRNQAHRSPTTALPSAPLGTSAGHGSRPKSPEEWQRSSAAWNQPRFKAVITVAAGEPSVSKPVKPRLVGISEGRPSTAPGDDTSEPQLRLKTTGRNPKESIRGLTFALTSHGGERRRTSVDATSPFANAVSSLPPYTKRDSHSAAAPRRRSSAFVDILDARGEMKPYDFRSRLQASGSRDYGEDVADRNLIESGAGLPSSTVPVLYPSLAGSAFPFRPRGSVSTANSYRHMTEIIPEQFEENTSAAQQSYTRPSSRQTTHRQSPRAKMRPNAVVSAQAPRALSLDVAALAEALRNSTDDPHCCHHKTRNPRGKISASGFRVPTPQRISKTSAGPYMRDDSSSLRPSTRSASPPGVPRYKSRQCSLPTDPLSSQPVQGSVRSAREALNNIASDLVRDRAMSPYQPRCETPTSPTHPHNKRENHHDWSRFNKHVAAEHLQPSTPPWEESNSDYSCVIPSSSRSECSRPRLDELEKHVPTRTHRRQGSISSFAPSEHSSPHFTGSRSIRTANTSIDLPHASLFREMKFGDGSSRSIRSRGGDSCIAPDCAGLDEDSCADSIFVSPATPLEEAGSTPLSRTQAEARLNLGGYDSASIYDSDTDSFREKRREIRQDGEALLFQNKGFGGESKSLPGLFNDSGNLPTPKWPEMPLMPTDPSEMGDDEESIVGGEPIVRKQRQDPGKPFTQRERLLALGYDYDSDSDVEASVDQEDIPEERALMLLVALVEASASTPVESKVGPHLNMNTVAKLRREIRKRKLMGPTSRRGSRFSTKENNDTETATNL